MHVPQRHWPELARASDRLHKAQYVRAKGTLLTGLIGGPADTQEGRQDAEHDERHTSGHGPHHEHDGAYATRECGGEGGHRAPLNPIKG